MATSCNDLTYRDKSWPGQYSIPCRSRVVLCARISCQTQGNAPLRRDFFWVFQLVMGSRPLLTSGEIILEGMMCEQGFFDGLRLLEDSRDTDSRSGIWPEAWQWLSSSTGPGEMPMAALPCSTRLLCRSARDERFDLAQALSRASPCRPLRRAAYRAPWRRRSSS